MSVKKAQKFFFLSVLLGVSMQSYADDTVNFAIELGWQTPAGIRSFYSLRPQAGDGVEVYGPIGPLQEWRFTFTNSYATGDVIKYENRQKQSGTIQLIYYDFYNYNNGQPIPQRLELCTATWEHDFWMDSKYSKHDRFYLSLTEGPCSISPSNNPNDADSGLHHSDRGKYIMNFVGDK